MRICSAPRVSGHLCRGEGDLVNGLNMSDQAHLKCSKPVIEPVPVCLGPSVLELDVRVKPPFVETIQNVEQRRIKTTDQTWSNKTHTTSS